MRVCALLYTMSTIDIKCTLVVVGRYFIRAMTIRWENPFAWMSWSYVHAEGTKVKERTAQHSTHTHEQENEMRRTHSNKLTIICCFHRCVVVTADTPPKTLNATQRTHRVTCVRRADFIRALYSVYNYYTSLRMNAMNAKTTFLWKKKRRKGERQREKNQRNYLSQIEWKRNTMEFIITDKIAFGFSFHFSFNIFCCSSVLSWALHTLFARHIVLILFFSNCHVNTLSSTHKRTQTFDKTDSFLYFNFPLDLLFATLKQRLFPVDTTSPSWIPAH